MDKQCMDIDIPSTSTTKSHVPVLIDRETQTNHINEVYTKYAYSSLDHIDNKGILLRRKVTLKQKVQKRDVKISNMKGLLRSIAKSGYSNENLDEVLKKHFEGLPLELVVLQKEKDEGVHPGQRRYSPLMKQFAHTLYFYSPKAYQFLREHFVLPNARTLRKWLSSLNCEPGILSEVLEFLKKEVNVEPYLKNCALIMDAMSIRKQVLWDHNEGKFFGHVNYGGLIDCHFEEPATEALFLQIVSYANNFKCPVAYFLTNKADAYLQTQLLLACLRSLFEVGITVRSITSDGAHANISTYNKLGCNIEYDNLKPYFIHPSNNKIRVYCILDICHIVGYLTIPAKCRSCFFAGE